MATATGTTIKPGNGVTWPENLDVPKGYVRDTRTGRLYPSRDSGHPQAARNHSKDAAIAAVLSSKAASGAPSAAAACRAAGVVAYHMQLAVRDHLRKNGMAVGRGRRHVQAKEKLARAEKAGAAAVKRTK